MTTETEVNGTPTVEVIEPPKGKERPPLMRFSGDKLRKRFKRSRMKIERLAVDSGATPNTLYRLMAGREPELSTLLRVAYALKSNITDFLEVVKPESVNPE